jgi:hypothetical protein
MRKVYQQHVDSVMQVTYVWEELTPVHRQMELLAK